MLYIFVEVVISKIGFICQGTAIGIGYMLIFQFSWRVLILPIHTINLVFYHIATVIFYEIKERYQMGV